LEKALLILYKIMQEVHKVAICDANE